MVDASQILVYLSTNKDRYKRDYRLIRIGIFGSFARDEQKDKSDIDLIVEFEDNTPDLYNKKQKLRDEIQARFNVPVDICREKYIKPIFKKLVLSEAKYV
jgi:predicted nucleotidyltransferase